jgi:hypothetical protein
MSKMVVARFQDGRIIKGTSMDVDPEKPMFHVRPQQGAAVEIRMSDLKALFFVRSLDGDSAREEGRKLDPKDVRSRGSTLVSLKFGDGEVMVGLTIRYPPNRPYFFLLPVDPNSNNIRILINRAAVTAMEALPSG